MPTLRFTQNVPQVIALQFSEGKIKPSSIPGNPDDMQYALATPPGMTAYLPISAAEMIRRAGITARQPFEICKVGKDDYRISTLSGTGSGGAGRVISTPVSESQVQGSNYTNVSPNHTAPAPAPAERIPPPPPAPASANRLAPATACMCSSMMSAVDAVMETQAYAARKGLGLTFSEESVRAIGLSIYISACKNGGAQ